MDQLNDSKLIFLTGATGYVGGRLLRFLEQQGRRVRCGVRRPDEFSAGESTEVVLADVLRPETLTPALEGVQTAFYMIHSMEPTSSSRTARELETSRAPLVRQASARSSIWVAWETPTKNSRRICAAATRSVGSCGSRAPWCWNFGPRS